MRSADEAGVAVDGHGVDSDAGNPRPAKVSPNSPVESMHLHP